MQLQGLRLGIEPATLDLHTNALPTELQKPLPWTRTQAHGIARLSILKRFKNETQNPNYQSVFYVFASLTHGKKIVHNNCLMLDRMTSQLNKKRL